MCLLCPYVCIMISDFFSHSVKFCSAHNCCLSNAYISYEFVSVSIELSNGIFPTTDCLKYVYNIHVRGAFGKFLVTDLQTLSCLVSF